MLAAILGNAHLAHEDLDSAHPAASSLAEIAQAAERGKALVDQILSFSRKRAREKRLLEPRSVVEESVKLLRATMPSGVELVTRFDEPVPAILADPILLQQIIYKPSSVGELSAAVSRLLDTVRGLQLYRRLTPGGARSADRCRWPDARG